MIKNIRAKSSLVFVMLFVMLIQGTWVLAGTTGGLSGTIVDKATNQGVPNMKVTVVSPSQQATAFTRGDGSFSFVSLAPDTYTLSVEKQGYNTLSQSGITVFADQAQTLPTFSTTKSLTTIGRVTSRAGSDLVKAGTTADVYSVDPTIADKAAALGGGGSLDQAYSAIASVPGVYIPLGQNGWNQAVFVRGSYYDQTGYEYDGVPVNRAFDNYAAHTASSLGQQELQVYSGGGPGGASATGLGGFINQVIKTGTYPGFASTELSIGGPQYTHRMKFEVGGATPNRNFSYYAGFTGSNQEFRYYDQNNGAGLSNLNQFGAILQSPNVTGTVPAPGVAGNCVAGASPATPVGVANNPGCYTNITQAAYTAQSIIDRETVLNFHFGIPHHKDGGKDDIQVLYTNSLLRTLFPISGSDLSSAIYAGTGLSSLNWRDGYTFPAGTTFGQSAAGLKATPYYFPNSPANRTFGSVLDPTVRAGFNNNSSIFKLQYQKNLGSSAYARIFGYSFYSDWLNSNPFLGGARGLLDNTLGVASSDYELTTHTRGFEAQIADQITNKHLLTGTFNYTYASVVRWNNSGTWNNSLTSRGATNLVDGAGNCYNAKGAVDLCNSSVFKASTGKGDYGSFANPTPYAATGLALANNAQWIVTLPGPRGSYSTTAPKFSSYSLQDQWNPTDRINLNIGIRQERFEYDLPILGNNPGKNFWYAAARRELCYNPVTNVVQPGFATKCAPGNVHPDGTGGAAYYSNSYNPTYVPPIVTEPRVQFTYRVSNDTVLRGSYGRYAQGPDTAAVFYARAEPNDPAVFSRPFIPIGFFSAAHAVRPAVASNYDFSLEQHVPKTDINFKLTPYYKYTIDNLQQVFIDQATQFVSTINSGNVKSYGVEFAATKGDFNRNGFAAQLSYTYTYARTRYNNLGTGSVNTIDQINNQIQNYNSYTKACATAPALTGAAAKASLCGAAGAANAVPFFANTGDGTPSTSSDGTAISNPYYNMPSQALLDRNGWYVPFGISPSVQGATSTSYYSPHVVAFVGNYKHDKLQVSPSFQVIAGQAYGVPTQVLGYDPASCTSNQGMQNGLGGVPSAIAAGRSAVADYTSCGNSFVIPNPETGVFDKMGSYNNPNQLLGNLKITYDFTPKVRASILLANLVNTCFGGSTAPWTGYGPKVCGYGVDAVNGYSYYSNFYNGASPYDVAANGGSAKNLVIQHSYYPTAQVNPLAAYFSLQFKI